MYYLRDGFAGDAGVETNRPNACCSLYASICILFASLGAGNMFQSNQAFRQVVQVTGGATDSWLAGQGWLFGLVMATVLGFVIIGGIKSIARVTEKLVPLMAILYMGIALIVIAANYQAIPFAIETIFQGAFRPEGIAGGMIGVAVMGIQRSVFSNEAGIGTASIVHSSVRTDYRGQRGHRFPA